MHYGDRQMIEGVPGDENTAVTMRAIKDLLEEAGASDMLLSDRPSHAVPATPAAQGPLGSLAAQAAAQPRSQGVGLQMPPPVGAVRVRPHAPAAHAQTETETRGGILSGLFGRK